MMRLVCGHSHDGLGQVGLLSTSRWSCIGRAAPKVVDQIPRAQSESQMPARAKYNDFPIEMPSSNRSGALIRPLSS
jgi:hypothetical protein